MGSAGCTSSEAGTQALSKSLDLFQTHVPHLKMGIGRRIYLSGLLEVCLLVFVVMGARALCI